MNAVCVEVFHFEKCGFCMFILNLVLGFFSLSSSAINTFIIPDNCVPFNHLVGVFI